MKVQELGMRRRLYITMHSVHHRSDTIFQGDEMGLAYGKIIPSDESSRNLESNQQGIQEVHSSGRPLSEEDKTAPPPQSGTNTCTGPRNDDAAGGSSTDAKSSCSDDDGAAAQATPPAGAIQQRALRCVVDLDESVGGSDHSEAELLGELYLSDRMEEAERPARQCKRASKMPRRPDKKRPRVTAGSILDDPFERQTLQTSHSAYFDALDVLLDEEVPVLGVERGECSEQTSLQDAAGAGELFNCNICMEKKPLAESFDVRPCLHMYCNGCTSRYVASKVEQNATSIRCPEPGCTDGILETEACRPILEEAVYQRWVASLCESAIGREGIYCPYRDCSALLIDDGGVRRAECPHCRREFCAQCRVPWHEGIRCRAFQALPEDERAREDLMLRELAADSKWQRCPQCKIFVERTDGCVFITCRCGHRFCYVCASPMSGESHFCKNCRRTW